MMICKKLATFFLSALFLLGLCGCNNTDIPNTQPESLPAAEASAQPDPTPSAESAASVNSVTSDDIAFSEEWTYDEADYVISNEEANAAWEEFKVQQDNGAPIDEILSTLSGVIIDDADFVPGYIEYARYYLLHYNETGDSSSPGNAMNILTRGHAHTGEPVLMQLKESLGWTELSKTIEQAKAALKECNSAAAFEIINTLPKQYLNISEASEIIHILNDFNDTYYYLILGDTLGHQYIVHFQIDGTFERVKMNEDGIFDSGTWESSFLDDWDLRFADLQFQGGSGSYFWTEYDSQYNVHEYKLNISTDGTAKEKFEYVAGLGEGAAPTSNLVSILTSSKWQESEGWYYQFNSDGTGTISMTDDSVSYGFTYFEHPEKENTIMITPSDMPDDYAWIYDPASGTFMQESYGFDMNTETAQVFYSEISVYNG